VLVDGKPNVDVRMGHTLSLRRQSSDYIPLYVANYILGGNFSARLMQIVRDQLGLTYGIRSALKGVTVDHDGFWEVSVTLSRDMVSRGIDETRKVLDAFVAQGVTEKELQAKKDTITGSFQVGLATTSGLGRSILANVERGFGVEYLDHFPEEIRSATLDEVNSALTRHLRPADLHIARSGSLAAGAEDASITPTP